jgi:hypothetical protein
MRELVDFGFYDESTAEMNEVMTAVFERLSIEWRSCKNEVSVDSRIHASYA